MPGANVWHFTAAGRAAVMDGSNRGINGVTFTRMAIGTGQGPGGAADDARVALRQQVGVENLGGSTAVEGRVAVEAAFTPANTVDVTEVGVFARVGAGAEFLAAYWTDGGRAIARAGGGDTIVLAGVLDLQSAAADVNVALAPALTLNPPTRRSTDLVDFPGPLVAGRFLQVNAAADAVDQKTAAQVLSTLLSGLASERFLRTVITGGQRQLEGVTLNALAIELMGLAITLRVFQASQVVNANAAARRWLVFAWGGGGGGGGVGNDGAAGGESSLVGAGVDVIAGGGAHGQRSYNQSANPNQGTLGAPVISSGSLAGAAAVGVAIPGAGAAGGEAARLAGHGAGTDAGAGLSGALVIALATPTPAGMYAVTVGAGGAGGAGGAVVPAGAGGAGGVAIVEFIP